MCTHRAVLKLAQYRYHLMQIAAPQLSVNGALRVLSAAGKQNYNSRRSIDIAVKMPSGNPLYNAPGVWKESTFALNSVLTGTYTLWCASCCDPCHMIRECEACCHTGNFVLCLRLAIILQTSRGASSTNLHSISK
jgi:hypothetical protein